jgi:hypothetical protein
VFAVLPLQCHDDKGDRAIDWNERADCLKQVGEQVPRAHQLWQRPDENRHVEQQRRIDEAGNGFAEQRGVALVMASEEREAGGQTSALFAGLE